MEKIISKLRKTALYNIALFVYDLPSLIQWILSKFGTDNRKKIRLFKNKYQGQRCFIIGNGPSLNKINFSLLKDEYSFGLNRFFLMGDKIGYSPTFLVSVNDLVLQQSVSEIESLKSKKFLSCRSRKFFRKNNNMQFIRSSSIQKFHKNVEYGVWEGATVTYVAMQLAYYMGFTEVILIGVDHNFLTKGPAHKSVVSKGDDPNHFDPNYFGKGFRWNLPDLETSEYAYKLAKDVYEKDGREILDATIGGKLRVFRKVKYKSCLNVL